MARIFVSNLPYRDRKPKYISKFFKKHGGDGKRWPLTPYPFPAPWPCCPQAIETPPRSVPAGPLISLPKNAPCSRISPRASRASLPPWQWAMTCCRLPLHPCTARCIWLQKMLSCSLQPILRLSLLSVGPSLLQFVSSWCHCDSVLFLLNHGNPMMMIVIIVTLGEIM